MGLFGPKLPPEQEFWNWFAANKHRIEADPENGHATAKLLMPRLGRVNKDLVWELVKLKDGTLELAISADGIKKVAPYVRRLVDAAPSIPGWKFVAFRQPKPNDAGPIGIKFPGVESKVGTDTVFASVKQNGWEYDLHIFHSLPPDISEDVVTNVMFLLLDESIGEYAMIYKVGHIEILPTSEKTFDAVPLDDLRNFIDITQTP